MPIESLRNRVVNDPALDAAAREVSALVKKDGVAPLAAAARLQSGAVATYGAPLVGAVAKDFTDTEVAFERLLKLYQGPMKRQAPPASLEDLERHFEEAVQGTRNSGSRVTLRRQQIKARELVARLGMAQVGQGIEMLRLSQPPGLIARLFGAKKAGPLQLQLPAAPVEPAGAALTNPEQQFRLAQALYDCGDEPRARQWLEKAATAHEGAQKLLDEKLRAESKIGERRSMSAHPVQDLYRATVQPRLMQRPVPEFAEVLREIPALDSLATTLEDFGRKREAAFIDLVSIFLDPSLSDADRAARARKLGPELVQRLESRPPGTVGGGSAVRRPSNDGAAQALVGWLEEIGKGGSRTSALGQALHRWGQVQSPELVDQLVSVAQAVDSLLRDSAEERDVGAIFAQLADEMALSAGKRDPKRYLKRLGDALRDSTARDKWPVVALRELLGISAGQSWLEVVDTKTALVPRDLPERERLLRLVSVLLDPTADREQKTEVAKRDFPVLQAALGDRWVELLSKLGRALADELRVLLPSLPPLGDFAEARFTDLGHFLAAQPSPAEVAERLDRVDFLRPGTALDLGQTLRSAAVASALRAQGFALSPGDLIKAVPLHLDKTFSREDAAALSSWVASMVAPDATDLDRRVALEEVSARLGTIARSLLVVADDKKPEHFFKELLERAFDGAKGLTKDSKLFDAENKKRAVAAGELFDRLFKELKEPEAAPRLEAQIDVVRFFIRAERAQLERIHFTDPMTTRDAIDQVAQDMVSLADMGVNLARIALLAKNDKVPIEERATEIRLAIEAMGAFFVKMVQTGVDYADVAANDPRYPKSKKTDGQVVIDSLMKLQNATQPIPYEQVEEVVLRSTGKTIEQQYITFEKEPFASASMAQVHRATIDVNGKIVSVVVKILKPTVKETIHHNFDLIRTFGKIAGAIAAEAFHSSGYKKKLDEKFPQLADCNTRDIFNLVDDFLRHLEHSFLGEGDLRDEARELTTMRRLLRSTPNLKVPRVYRKHSGEACLTMEELRGKKIRDILIEDPNDPRAGDLRTQLPTVYGAMGLVHRKLHGDLHGGNLGVQDDGTLVLYDFGLVLKTAGRIMHPALLATGFMIDSPALMARSLVRLADKVPGGVSYAKIHNHPDDVRFFESLLGTKDLRRLADVNGVIALSQRQLRKALRRDLRATMERCLAKAEEEVKKKERRPPKGRLATLQQRLKIRAVALGMAAPEIFLRASSRHGLQLSAQYFQLAKTTLAFGANWHRLRGSKTPVNKLAIARELLLYEPAWKVTTMLTPGFVLDALETRREAKAETKKLQAAEAKKQLSAGTPAN